jgi:ribosome biogenesis protein ENP2
VSGSFPLLLVPRPQGVVVYSKVTTWDALSDPLSFQSRDMLMTRLGLTHLIGTPALKPYMHGYFLSLKLYTTARLIANPQSYDEHREKLISQRLAAKAESRIRAKKEQPKVNKALAERLRRAAEREEALEKKKRERKAARAAGEGEAEAGGDVPEEVDTPATSKSASSSSAGGVLSDPRFQELFENPDFEVDEASREFALLNPATADKNALRKTAVQDEEDESDRSSGLGESDEDDDDGDASDDGDGAAKAGGVGGESDSEDGSGDSDDGDLRQYDPRKVRPGQTKRAFPAYRPQMVVGSSGGYDDPRSASSSSFGQRLRTSTAGGSSGAGGSKGDPRLQNVLAMRRAPDGGMEMSFIPKSSASSSNRRGGGGDEDEQDEYSGGTRRKDREPPSKVERFGAGLQKGLERDEEEGALDGEGRSGRTGRRRVGEGRSASKNAFRRK